MCLQATGLAETIPLTNIIPSTLTREAGNWKVANEEECYKTIKDCTSGVCDTFFLEIIIGDYYYNIIIRDYYWSTTMNR